MSEFLTSPRWCCRCWCKNQALPSRASLTLEVGAGQASVCWEGIEEEETCAVVVVEGGGLLPSRM